MGMIQWHGNLLRGFTRLFSSGPGVLNQGFGLVYQWTTQLASFSTDASPFSMLEENTAQYLRNVALMAHVDAGKTSTSEAVMLLSGELLTKGSVDDGSTAMDFLPQERAMGITIQSAATSIKWRNFAINLIDTPGHIDFSAEVEASITAIDGAVLLVDAAKGVEAQTASIWRLLRQSYLNKLQKMNDDAVCKRLASMNKSGHQQFINRTVPRIIFANKIDREGADEDSCLQSVRKRLNTWPLQVNVPIIQEKYGSCWAPPIISMKGVEQITLSCNEVKREWGEFSIIPRLHLIDLTDLCCRSYFDSYPIPSRIPKVVVTPPPMWMKNKLLTAGGILELIDRAEASLASISSEKFACLESKGHGGCFPAEKNGCGFTWWHDARIMLQVLKRRQTLIEDLSLLDGIFESAFYGYGETGKGGSNSINVRDIHVNNFKISEINSTDDNKLMKPINAVSSSDHLGYEIGKRYDMATKKIWEALKRIVLSHEGCTLVCLRDSSAVPLFFGSALHTVGIDVLLDAVTALLPSPSESPPRLYATATREAELALQQAVLQSQKRTGWTQTHQQHRPVTITQHVESVSINIVNIKKDIIPMTSGAHMAEENAMKSKAVKADATSRLLHTPHGRTGLFYVCSQITSAAVFKVISDGKGGRIAYCRVFSGTINPSTYLFNPSACKLEFVRLVYKPKAAEFVSMNAGKEGDVAVLVGLKYTKTGDTLHSIPACLNSCAVGSSEVSIHSQNITTYHPLPIVYCLPWQNYGVRDYLEPLDTQLSVCDGLTERQSAGMQTDVKPDRQLCPLTECVQSYTMLTAIHENGDDQMPVCFISFHHGSQADEQQLLHAIDHILLQDPSLKFERTANHSFVLWGRGELQLKLARERLETEFGVKTWKSSFEISYREYLLKPLKGSIIYPPVRRKKMNSSRCGHPITLKMKLSLTPLPLRSAESRLCSLLKSTTDSGCVEFSFCLPVYSEHEEGGSDSDSGRIRKERRLGVSWVDDSSDNGQPSDVKRMFIRHQTRFSVFFTCSDRAMEQLRVCCPKGKTQCKNEKEFSDDDKFANLTLSAIEKAVSTAFLSGPLGSYPVDAVSVNLSDIQSDGIILPEAAAAAAGQLVRQLLRNGSTGEVVNNDNLSSTSGLEEVESHDACASKWSSPREFVGMLEPVIHLEVWCPMETVGIVTNDLVRNRQASVVEVSVAGRSENLGEDVLTNLAESTSINILSNKGVATGDMLQIHAVVSLRRVEGYSSALLSMSNGLASCWLSPFGYAPVPEAALKEIISLEAKYD